MTSASRAVVGEYQTATAAPGHDQLVQLVPRTSRGTRGSFLFPSFLPRPLSGTFGGRGTVSRSPELVAGRAPSADLRNSWRAGRRQPVSETVGRRWHHGPHVDRAGLRRGGQQADLRVGGRLARLVPDRQDRGTRARGPAGLRA